MPRSWLFPHHSRWRTERHLRNSRSTAPPSALRKPSRQDGHTGSHPKPPLRSRVGCAAHLGHHDHPELANGEASDPCGYPKGRLAAHRFGQRGQPLGHLRRFIVNDVVNAGTSAVERLHRRQCRIIDVNERPYTRTAADDRHLPLSHLLDKVASLPERIARSIKPSVAKSNSGRSGKACDRLFQVANRPQSAPEGSRRIRIKGSVFCLHRAARTANLRNSAQSSAGSRLRAKRQSGGRALPFSSGSSAQTPDRSAESRACPAER